MFCIVGVCFPIIGKNRKIASFGDAEPGSLLCPLEIASTEYVLMMGGPPMGATSWTEDEFVSIVQDNKGVVRMSSGCENNAHSCCIYVVEDGLMAQDSGSITKWWGEY
jgi:hypothetical protein